MIRSIDLSERNTSIFFQNFPSYHSPAKVQNARNTIYSGILPMLGNIPERKRGKRKFMYPVVIYVLSFQDFGIKKTFINVKKLIALILRV